MTSSSQGPGSEDDAPSRDPRPAFSWATSLEELADRREAATGHGGPDRVARQHEAGKKTARERVDALTDTFQEVGGLARLHAKDAAGNDAETLPSGYVCGLGEVDGRAVAVGAEDYTVRGGAPTAYLDRMKGGWGGFIEDFARDYRIPLILLLEGVGGDVSTLDKGYGVLPSTYGIAGPVALLGQVPVLTAVMGPAAGATAARAVLSHWSVMTPAATLFSGGPPLVRAALGIDVDKHELGGLAVHTKITGSVDNPATDDDDAIRQVRQVLGYLPQNVWELPARGAREDPADRPTDELLELMPESRRRAYDVRPLIELIADAGSVFEIGPAWGRAVVTALARMDGIPVGFVANNPVHVAGAMDARAAEKQTRFVELCSTFHLPLVFLVDVPGVLVGPESERQGVVRWGVRAARALVDSNVPVVTIHTGRAYGLAVNSTADPSTVCLRLAWPSAEIGDIPIQGGVRAAFRREIDAAPDPGAHAAAIEARFNAIAGVWGSAEAFAVEDVIDPRETRATVSRFLNASLGALKLTVGPWRRDGFTV
jgi:acetyl-CoA carboxylase carboxyltransferase component